MAIRIYLDACCLNRPFDDQSQDRIRLEAEAVILILTHVEEGGYEWTASDVLRFESDQMPDAVRRDDVRALLSAASRLVALDRAAVARAAELERIGFRSFDALHLACAEADSVDVFLTTDDRFLGRARRFADRLRVQVENPLTWLSEQESQL